MWAYILLVWIAMPNASSMSMVEMSSHSACRVAQEQLEKYRYMHTECIPKFGG